ncbi:uncharacterized protein LOC9634219 [Selaginella moellendorffii]|nr:uncharacterized protein LOC9634219 [Selaginella moellendorffii]|eukprot:XP_002981995.2 uncharacterized protein LOC9634219 [Selaginella moellendorffii]
MDDMEWVRRVCRAMEPPPTEPWQLEKALGAPLLERLPVSWKRLAQLEGVFGRDKAAALFASPAECQAEDVSTVASLVLNRGYQFPSWEDLHSLCLTGMWEVCLRYLDPTMQEVLAPGTNSVTMDEAETKSWPDLLLFAKKRLVFKSEHRARREELGSAWSTLAYSLGNISPCFHRGLDWTLGAATGARMLRFGVFWPDGDMVLSPLLDIGYVSSRYEAIKSSTNLIRIALSWLSVLEESNHTMLMPYQAVASHVYGNGNITRKLEIVDGIAIKTIQPWKLHELHGYSKMEYVERAYSVKSRHVARLDWQRDIVRDDVYRVQSKVFGFPARPTQQEQLVQAVKHTLLGLDALHGAGLVHRDLEWSNVIYNEVLQVWVIQGLECVWKAGEVPVVQGQWTQEVLVDGKYTSSSDLCLSG